MSFTVVEFEPTPNPNAVKCLLDKPVSTVPRSFLNREMASEDALAQALFDEADATTVLFNGNWISVNKRPEASWEQVRAKIRKVLAEAK